MSRQGMHYQELMNFQAGMQPWNCVTVELFNIPSLAHAYSTSSTEGLGNLH